MAPKAIRTGYQKGFENLPVCATVPAMNALRTRPLKRIAAAAAVMFLAVNASAQTAPAGLMQTAPATSGTTDVAEGGFEQAKKEPELEQSATELDVAAGGLFAVGNSRAVSYTGAGTFKLRRARHQLKIASSLNYGKAAPDRDTPMQVTVENVQGRLRYDYFLTKRLAAFLGLSARRDRFQGLALRLNIDPGLAYYAIDVAQHQLWFEGGYDYQLDLRDQAAVDDAALAGAPLSETESRHHARVFVGYENKLNEAVALNAGAEYLQAVSPFEDNDTGHINWQLNSYAGLTSRLGERFSFNTTLNVRYDNNPLSDFESTDAVTAITLVYSLL
jgi:putative salt-induced outer membrane protein